MLAILKRELSSYFSSPLGYIFLAVFTTFAGLFYFTECLLRNSADINYIFSAMFMVILFLIPITTMRLLSEDKKQKTDQALLTAPISLFSLVMGKFLAALILFAMAISVIIIIAGVTGFFGLVNWALVWGNALGLLLLGGALISIGLFISSLTENQVVAAVASFGVMLLLWMLEGIAMMMPWEAGARFLRAFSISARYADFTYGILNFSNIIFFLSITAIFIYFTIRVFEKRRWS